MISQDRLAKHFAAMKNFSTPNCGAGINRLAFSDSDWQGRDYLISLMQDAGLAIRTDAFGNVIGRREGSSPALPAIMFGSHGDSVPSGGNYDGVVGILCAIEAVKSMQEDGFQNEHPLEVVLFMSEESSRFGSATLGSKAMRGELTVKDLQRLTDKNGTTLYEALKSRALDPDHIEKATYKDPLKAFFEVHIEQGKVLEHEKKSLGIVTGIAAPTRFKVYLHGSADHSGATPMTLRSDGLCAAAEIILQVEKLAAAQTSPGIVGTVGVIRIHPGAMNVIPGEVELGIDIRSISAAAKAEVTAKVLDSIDTITAARSITYDIEKLSDEIPVSMKPEMICFFEKLCRQQNRSFMTLPSGAGHDAMHWASYTHTGMLFIPCKDGISHNPAESAKIEDIILVAELLEESVKMVSKKEFTWNA
ncbi:MAG: M20 family metallo-hydrolase [Selenomonadaceae bacterium]